MNTLLYLGTEPIWVMSLYDSSTAGEAKTGERPEALFGYNSRGEPVQVPLNHTGISGINNSGKTEAAKALAKRFAEAGVTELIMDVKTIQPDYSGFGDARVPVYIERATAPETIEDLLEQTEDRSFNREFHRILKAYKILPEEKRSMANMLKVMQGWIGDYEEWEQRYARKEAKWIERPLHPLDNKADNTIVYFLEKLVNQVDAIKPANTLALPGMINVMDLTALDRDYQQLPFESMLKYVEANRNSLAKTPYMAIMVDEFTRFAPQSAKAAAKQRMIYAIKEFRAGKTYFIVIDQTLSGVHINVRKQIWNWIMGRQNDTAESERVIKEVPADLRRVPGSPVTPDMVKQLKTGWFVVWTEKGVDVAFAAPCWAPLDESRKVAMGDMTPKQLADKYQGVETRYGDNRPPPKPEEVLPSEFEDRVEALERRLEKLEVM